MNDPLDRCPACGGWLGISDLPNGQRRCQNCKEVWAPVPTEARAGVSCAALVGAINRISGEIFNLSQQSGVPESVRKPLDDARESLRAARVNVDFDAPTAESIRPESKP